MRAGRSPRRRRSCSRHRYGWCVSVGVAAWCRTHGGGSWPGPRLRLRHPVDPASHYTICPLQPLTLLKLHSTSASLQQTISVMNYVMNGRRPHRTEQNQNGYDSKALEIIIIKKNRISLGINYSLDEASKATDLMT